MLTRSFTSSESASTRRSSKKGISRSSVFFNLDSRVYEDGALPAQTKELLGLVASVVLRCDDCITYHILRCQELSVTKEEFYEAFSVALVVGGSITIPHLRRAVDRMDAGLS